MGFGIVGVGVAVKIVTAAKNDNDGIEARTRRVRDLEQGRVGTERVPVERQPPRRPSDGNNDFEFARSHHTR